MIPIIIPSILENDFDAFAKKFKTVEKFAPIIQVDVMDGQFVPNVSFAEIEKINEINSQTKLEFHLMVADPLTWINKLKVVKNIVRVIFHIEATNDPATCIKAIKNNGWEVGVAINADTDLAKIEPYYKQIEAVVFMLVKPGQQGGKLLTAVGERIKKFVALKNRPLCAIDGGINENNIELVKSWGVEIFGIGSAIVKSDDPKKSYFKFLSLIGG